MPYTLNWSFGIQHELPGSIRVEAAYVGSRGLQLTQSNGTDHNLNQLIPEQLQLCVQLQQKAPNPYDRRAERSVSPNDISQRLVLSYVYELPFGRGKPLGGGWSPWMDAFMGGWQVNGITVCQTGQPLSITAANSSNSGKSSLRANNKGQSAALSGEVESRLLRYFDTSVFSQPPPFTFGKSGRTLPDVRGPGLRGLDFSLFKSFPLRERMRLEFRAESFNVTNTPQFGFPDQNVNDVGFGQISSQLNDPRQIQFGLKLLF